jgi:hypothetical protein
VTDRRPIYQPLPENYSVPDETSTESPDLASPGFWCTVFDGKEFKSAWVQTAFNETEDHEAKPPEAGLPGSWMTVYGDNNVARAWIPSPPEPNKPPAVPEKK